MQKVYFFDAINRLDVNFEEFIRLLNDYRFDLYLEKIEFEYIPKDDHNDSIALFLKNEPYAFGYINEYKVSLTDELIKTNLINYYSERNFNQNLKFTLPYKIIKNKIDSLSIQLTLNLSLSEKLMQLPENYQTDELMQLCMWLDHTCYLEDKNLDAVSLYEKYGFEKFVFSYDPVKYNSQTNHKSQQIPLVIEANAYSKPIDLKSVYFLESTIEHLDITLSHQANQKSNNKEKTFDFGSLHTIKVDTVTQRLYFYLKNSNKPESVPFARLSRNKDHWLVYKSLAENNGSVSFDKMCKVLNKQISTNKTTIDGIVRRAGKKISDLLKFKNNPFFRGKVYKIQKGLSIELYRKTKSNPKHDAMSKVNTAYDVDMLADKNYKDIEDMGDEFLSESGYDPNGGYFEE